MSQSWWNDLEVRKVVGQRYQLGRLLREEPWGNVWLARDLVLKTEVGLKLMSRDAPDFEQARSIFVREASLGFRLRQPQILAVMHLGETLEEIFLVEEPFPGETLLASLNRLQRYRLAQALGLLEQACRALAFAHRHHAEHQALDPSNILVHESQVRVANFAMSTVAEDEEVGRLELRAFQAPEVLKGEEVSPRSNVFSLGVLGFRLLVGSLPYPLTFDELFPYRLETLPLDLEEVPIPLQNLLLRCLAVDPEERFEDAGAFLSALEEHRELWRLGAPKVISTRPPQKTGEAVAAVRAREILGKLQDRGKDWAGKAAEGLKGAGERLQAVQPRLRWGLAAGVLALVALILGVRYMTRQPTVPPSVPPAETPVAAAKPPVVVAPEGAGAPEGRPATAPGADQAPAEAGPTAGTAVQPSQQEPYFVQAATYNKKRPAEILAKRLKEKKYPIRLATSAKGGKTIFVVWIGPLIGKKAAEEAAQRLKSDEGLTGKVVKAPSRPSKPGRS